MSSKKSVQQNGHQQQELQGITHITVSGYKSISREQTIEIRPLTVLAGANSSGKSSIMQPLLLMKQTLEATYDPGALLLNGPNIKFTSFDQLCSKQFKEKSENTFSIGIAIVDEVDNFHPEGGHYLSTINRELKIYFSKQSQGEVAIREMFYKNDDWDSTISLWQGMSETDILAVFPESIKDSVNSALKEEATLPKEVRASTNQRLMILRDRCYLKTANVSSLELFLYPSNLNFPPVDVFFTPLISEIIHLPGLRGNPERTYPVTAVGSAFPGTFEAYTASIIAHWQVEKKEDKITQLSTYLERLGLTWKVAAKRINDTQVELQVGRLANRKGRRDLVNIADVGVGVSQTLPVLVALLTAKPGQLVYLEQPEIHLHPRAQTAMAQVLADAAMRGVRVVAETHSSLLLLGIQTLVAEGKLPSELVKLHWFTRGDDGATTIRSADLDETGVFGDWPEDFAETSLEIQSRYLDAVEARHWKH